MSRIVTISKTKLIETLKTNKEAHIKDYDEAVEAYIEEVNKQLVELKDKIDSGDFNISLHLIKPVNNAHKYEEIIKLFEWEINENVDLTKQEFEYYVLDKASFAEEARFSNQTYKGF